MISIFSQLLKQIQPSTGFPGGASGKEPAVFITALFIIARTRKQPRCPSADEWIRKLWYIYTYIYIQPLKRIHLNQF